MNVLAVAVFMRKNTRFHSIAAENSSLVGCGVFFFTVLVMFFVAMDCGAFHFVVKQSKKKELVRLLGHCDEGTVILQKHKEQLTLTPYHIP